MFTGDSLTVISMLLGVASGAALGAIGANPGSPRTWLWRICILFLATTAAWIFAPTANQLVLAVKPIVSTIVRSGAFFMIGAVTLVLLTISGRRTPIATASPPLKSEPAPKFAPYPKLDTKWVPDITFNEASIYITGSSQWEEQRIETSWENVEALLRNALIRGKLTGWAKAHPDDEQMWQVQKDAWEDVEVNRQQSYAFFTWLGCAGHSVMLCKQELEEAYPPTKR